MTGPEEPAAFALYLADIAGYPLNVEDLTPEQQASLVLELGL